MKNPVFKNRLVRLLSTASVAMAATVAAQPDTGPKKNAAPRARPQVIYHLPPASNYAATLHSQAKRQSNDLPIDNDMPASLQLSRANANAAAAEPEQAETPRPPVVRERKIRPRLKLNRPSPRSFARPPGHGKGHRK